MKKEMYRCHYNTQKESERKCRTTDSKVHGRSCFIILTSCTHPKEPVFTPTSSTLALGQPYVLVNTSSSQVTAVGFRPEIQDYSSRQEVGDLISRKGPEPIESLWNTCFRQIWPMKMSGSSTFQQTHMKK